MKILLILSLIFGVFLTLFGGLPFIITYPFSDGPNAGPSNFWELVQMVAYEGQVWYLTIGIIILVLSVVFLSKLRTS